MAQASTGITFNATAINKTGRVFRQIGQQALGVAKMAAGMFSATMLTRAFDQIVAVTKELAALNDVAMRAGVSAKEITQMSTALAVLGIKSQTPDQIAMAMQKMAKATGETGVAGFERVIGAISQMGTVEERAAAAMATFGKSGLDFLPLIEAAAKNGTDALHEVIDAMPGVSDAAAEAGDKMADGMKVMTDGIKTLYHEGIAKIVQLIDSQFAGGIREAALKGAAYMEFFAKVAWRYVSTFYDAWSKSSEGILDGFKTAVLNLMDLLGGLVTASISAMIQALRAKIQPMVDAVMWAYIRLTQGEDAAAEFWIEAEKQQLTATEAMKEPFRDLADYAATLKWFPDGTSVDISDLQGALADKLANAGSVAAAIGSKAAASLAASAAEDTAEQIGNAAKAAKADFMTADTYRAATMSIRADYGKNESKTVKAIDRVKSINEKIKSATESSAAALANLGLV